MYSKYFLVNTTKQNFVKLVQDITELFHLVSIDNDNLAEKINSSTLKITVQFDKSIYSLSVEFFRADLWDTLQEKFFADNLPSYKVKHLFKFYLLTILKKIMPYQKVHWGVLRGVRPLKLVHNILAQNVSEKTLPDFLTANYLLTPERATLVTNIARLQRPFLADKEAVVVYINIPYCPSKCTYCSFPSAIIPRERALRMRFLEALEQDIINVSILKESLSLKVVAIYIGGGTPSCLPTDEFIHLLTLVNKYLLNDVVKEFTVEAGRPDTINSEKISAMKTFGVNRVSINSQTMNNQTLHNIGREHSAETFLAVYEQLFKANAFRLNIDLILGLPKEGLAEVEHSFEKSLQLLPDNLTVHTLALKKDAALFYQRENLPTENLAEEMLELSYQLLPKANYLPYYLYRQKYILANLENIGYTQKNKECLYNILVMEERHHVIGIGPTAASKAVIGENKLEKFYMPKNIDVYLENLSTNFIKRREIFGPK